MIYQYEYRYPLNADTNNADWICDVIEYMQHRYPDYKIWWRISVMSDELIVRVQENLPPPNCEIYLYDTSQPE